MQAPNDLLENRIQVLSTSLAVALPFISTGRVKVLAVTSKQRSPAAPDVPTAAQAGYPVLLLKTAGPTLPAAMLRHTVDRSGREYVERMRSMDEEKDVALVENRVVAYL